MELDGAGRSGIGPEPRRKERLMVKGSSLAERVRHRPEDQTTRVQFALYLLRVYLVLALASAPFALAGYLAARAI